MDHRIWGNNFENVRGTETLQPRRQWLTLLTGPRYEYWKPVQSPISTSDLLSITIFFTFPAVRLCTQVLLTDFGVNSRSSIYKPHTTATTPKSIRFPSVYRNLYPRHVPVSRRHSHKVCTPLEDIHYPHQYTAMYHAKPTSTLHDSPISISIRWREGSPNLWCPLLLRVRCVCATGSIHLLAAIKSHLNWHLLG